MKSVAMDAMRLGTALLLFFCSSAVTQVSNHKVEKWKCAAPRGPGPLGLHSPTNSPGRWHELLMQAADGSTPAVPNASRCGPPPPAPAQPTGCRLPADS